MNYRKPNFVPFYIVIRSIEEYYEVYHTDRKSLLYNVQSNGLLPIYYIINTIMLATKPGN